MASVLFYFMIPIAMLATAVVLGVGIYSLAKGGDFSRQNGNKLMQLRVLLQGIAVLLMMIFFWIASSGA